MKDIEIKISRETRKIIEISKLVIGNDGENLQGNLVFSFSDEFVRGQARLEYVLEDIEDVKNKKYQPLMQVNETYGIPIKSILTKEGKLFMQLVITEGTQEEEIPVFKSNVFFVKIKESINAKIEELDEYPTWIEIANTKLNQIDNLDISAVKVDNVATITVTDKNGNKNSVEIYDGEQGPQGIQGPQGVQGPKPVKGVDYYTEEEKSEFVESITNDANSKFNQNVNEKTTTFNDNASSKLEKFNDNVTSKTNSFNENVTTKTEEFNTNATNRTTTFNDNATSKLNEFNDNAISKVQEYNDNVDNLLGNVDAICPKNEVSGEYITIDDAMQYKVFETKIDGNSYQETTTGKNKLDFETLFENADFVTKNGDNYSFVGDSSSHFLKKDYELEVGTWILSFDYTSNNIVISASGNLIALNAYHEDGSSEWIKVVTDTTVNNSRITVPFTITEKITSLQLQQFNRFTSGTITISNIQIGVDNIYEKYTGSVPSPNPDYPQDIEVIDGYNLLPNEAISQTIDGVDFIVNQDKSIVIKGTGSKTISYPILGNSSATSEVLKLKSGTTYSNYTGMVLTYRLTNGDYGSILNGASIIPSEDMSLGFVYLSFTAGTTIDTTVYPMLIKGTKIKSYVPYGCINNKVVGKNLYNKDTEIKGYIYNTSGKLAVSDTWNTSDLFFVDVDKTYTMSIKSTTSSNFLFTEFDKNKNFLQRLQFNGILTTMKYTPSLNTKYVSISHRNDIDISEIQLEKDSATEYEPYKENTYNINLQDNFIAKIGDTKDELVIDKKGNVSLVKRIGKVVLDGSEKLNYSVIQGDYLLTQIRYSEMKISTKKILSDSFIFAPNWGENYNVESIFCGGSPNNCLQFKISTSRLSSPAETGFKTWLTENNVIVYYELAEPQIIDLGTLDTPIETFEGINNISVITNLDTNINVKYALDIKKYTDKKVEELTNALISTSANV